MNSFTKITCVLLFLAECGGILFAQGPCGGKPCEGGTTPTPTRRQPAAKPRSATKTPPLAAAGDSRPVTGSLPPLPANVSQAQLTAIGGRKFKLADYSGKVLVVNLWATWCGPCRLEVPELVKLHKQFKSRGVEVVGLSTEDPDYATESVRNFMRDFEVSYRIGWAQQDVATTLMQGRDAIPQSFVISRDGRVVKRFVGFNPTKNPALIRQAIEDALNYKTEFLREDSTPPGLVPTTAELTIRTTPANTLILIDGQDVGVTGEDGVLNLPTFKPGEHIIVARRERYRDAQRTIMLKANRSQIAQLDLSPMTGILNVNVPGDAHIEIDGHGSYADKVSNLELDAGSYSITASKPGYQTIRKTVEIVPGLRVDETLALEPAVTADPQLAFVGRENFQSGRQNWIRYKLTVTNRTAFSPDLFAAAPELPPCGLNTKASRTWVDVYDQRGVRLYGFCAFSKPSDLDLIWFALPAALSPPSVYVVLNDRLSGKKYKSKLLAIP